MEVTDPVVHRLLIDLVALVLGLSVGSFLNVLALRTLAEISPLWPPSHCPRCKKTLSVLDNIPVLSYILLRGKCRNCQLPISWQYPAVELFTAITFVLIAEVFLQGHVPEYLAGYWGGAAQSFGTPNLHPVRPWIDDPQTWNRVAHDPKLEEIIQATSQLLSEPYISIGLTIGMVFFAGTLIAVTVTDFREKLIPHEITYPSMLFGLIFSALVRNDLGGALIGVGASYILFDFLAFYGLKIYLLMKGHLEAAERPRRLIRLRARTRRRKRSKRRWGLDLANVKYKQADEPMEVMGGGDAVLSAVISAYLGWQLLVVALLIGFIVGTLMGVMLLLFEMKKANILHKCLQNSLLFGVVGAVVMALCGLPMDMTMGTRVAPAFAVLGAIGGALLGVVSVGTHVSKPYPFGPALAAGGFVAMFLVPSWLSFH